MRKKSLICILGLCISMLFAACGSVNPLIVKIDDISYDLSGDFQDVIGEMVENDLLVKDYRSMQPYDKKGRYRALKDGENKLDMGACLATQKPVFLHAPGIIESIYNFKEDYETVTGINDKSSVDAIKANDEYVKYRGMRRVNNEDYVAMYIDNKAVDINEYRDELRLILRDFDVKNPADVERMKELYFSDMESIPSILCFSDILSMLSKDDFLKENNGKNLYVDISLSIALAANDAAEKLRDGDIDSYSILYHEINEEYTETEYRVYTYDEDWDVEKFRTKR